MAVATNSGSYSYEVYCNHCRVSFPVGTRRCLHCGGATSPERSGSGTRTAPMVAPSLEALPSLDEIGESAPPPGRPRVGFSPTSLVWLLFLVVYGVFRTCT
jgi:hypothetical protein